VQAPNWAVTAGHSHFYGEGMTLLDDAPARGPRVAVRRTMTVPTGFDVCGDFAWRRTPDRIEIVHGLDESTISDSAMIAGLLPLVEQGVVVGQAGFEEAATAVIRTSAGTEARSWAAFYDNSLDELRSGRSPFSPIHGRARSLVAGDSVLEVGSCFGFFALQCADDGRRVAACDISPGAVALLSANARRLCTPVEAVLGDATALPFPTSSVDTVTLIHLLEHLDQTAATSAVSEALRVARLRVVIAVPYEEDPSEHFGHRARLTEAHLRRWADAVDHAGAQYLEDHGGWLVLRPVP
jgi:SAM-dependent methyltransferase